MIESPAADSAMIASAFAVARAQGQPEQIEAYRRIWWLQNSIFAAMPAILLGILFLLAAWVRKGFATSRATE